MATVNALITSPTPLVSFVSESSSNNSYTNNTGRYLIIMATRSSTGWAGNIEYTVSGGGGPTFNFYISTQVNQWQTFVMVPGASFSIPAFSGIRLIGYSLSPSF